MFNERRDNVFLVAVVTTPVGVDKMPLRQRNGIVAFTCCYDKTI